MCWNDILGQVDFPGELLVVTDNGETTSNTIAEVGLEDDKVRFSFADTRLFGLGGLREVPTRGDLVIPLAIEPEIMGGAIVFDSTIFRVSGTIYLGRQCTAMLQFAACTTTQAPVA